MSNFENKTTLHTVCAEFLNARDRGDLMSSHISGCAKTTFQEWQLACAHMYPPYCDHSAAAICELPMLSGKFSPGMAQRPNRNWGWLFNPDTAPRLFTGERIPCPPRPGRQRSHSARMGEPAIDPSRTKGPPPMRSAHVSGADGPSPPCGI